MMSTSMFVDGLRQPQLARLWHAHASDPSPLLYQRAHGNSPHSDIAGEYDAGDWPAAVKAATERNGIPSRVLPARTSTSRVADDKDTAGVHEQGAKNESASLPPMNDFGDQPSPASFVFSYLR
jgi:hypothetical protein